MSSTVSASRQRFHEIWRLAWPIIVSNISVPLLGLVDTAVMGHLPDPRYLAAVTLGATLFSFLFWGFGFLRMGTTGLAAQAFGAGDDQALRNLLAQSLMLALSLGLLLIVLSTPIIEPGLWLLHGEADTRALAEGYAHIRIFSAPAVLINYVVIGWFLGQQNTRVTLILMLSTNTLNILLDLLFVNGLQMASNGVAAASAIAETITLVVGLTMVRQRLKALRGGFDARVLKQPRAWATLFRVNRHLFVRTLCLLFAMAFFTSQGARMGDTTLAANAVLMQLIMMTSYGLDGFANAAEALTGRAAGRHDWADFARSVRACLLFSLITAGGASLIFAVAGNGVIALLTDLTEVRGLAGDYLGWVIVMPLFAVWSYLFDGVFIGATETRAMRDTLILAVVVYLPVWWLTRGLGNHGLWLSFTLFMLVRSAGLAGVYGYRRRHDWQ